VLLISVCSATPNYVDLERFEDVIQRESDGKIRVLFPRRLSHERGFLLALSVARELSGLYSQVEFHFTGDRPSELVDTEMGRKDGVHFQKYQFDDMHMAYANADIVIIPTIHSEGTSLSCLEALASGKAVVASDVGGLPNLIVDGFNGLLIRPNRQELKRALETLINNKELRERLSRNALSVAQVFSKKRWREKWEMEIKELEG
jgi:glycosyltransferase involved in cell wall biosynthesis